MSEDSVLVVGGVIQPMAGEEVDRTVDKIIDEGQLLAVVMRAKNGDIGMKVIGVPTEELADALERLTADYRRVVRGH